jgi:hypothetical protein
MTGISQLIFPGAILGSLLLSFFLLDHFRDYLAEFIQTHCRVYK